MSEEKLPTVYVGPTLSKIGLVQYHHYIDIELNEPIQAAIAKYPVLRILFIPLEQFSTRAPDIYAGRDASIIHAAKQLVKQGVF